MTQPTTQHTGDGTATTHSIPLVVLSLHSTEVVKPKQRRTSATTSFSSSSPRHRHDSSNSPRSRQQHQHNGKKGKHESDSGSHRASRKHGRKAELTKERDASSRTNSQRNKATSTQKHLTAVVHAGGRTAPSPTSPRAHKGDNRASSDDDAATPLRNVPPPPPPHTDTDAPAIQPHQPQQLPLAPNADVSSALNNGAEERVNAREEPLTTRRLSQSHPPHATASPRAAGAAAGSFKMENARDSWKKPLPAHPYPDMTPTTTTAPVHSAARGSSLSPVQPAFPLFLPSFANLRRAPGDASPLSNSAVQHHRVSSGSGTGAGQLPFSGASSTPQLASSVPVKPAARTQLLPENPHGSSAFFNSRRGSGGWGRYSMQQQQQQFFMQQARRTQQSVGEWNLGPRVSEAHDVLLDDHEEHVNDADRGSQRHLSSGNNFYSYGTFHSHTTRMAEASKMSGGGAAVVVQPPSVRARAPSALQDLTLPFTEDLQEEAAAHHSSLRDFAFPSVFGDAATAASPHQSFTRVPVSQPSTFLNGGLSYGRPSVMWRSAGDAFGFPGEAAAAQAADEDGDNKMNRGPAGLRASGGSEEGRLAEGKKATAAVQPPLSPNGLASEASSLHAWYSFVSPTLASPHAFTEERKEEQREQSGELVEEVKHTAGDPKSLRTARPLSVSDDYEEEGDGTTGASAEATASNETVLVDVPLHCKARVEDDHAASAARWAQADAPRQSPVSPQAFVNKSSFFVTSDAFFREDDETSDKNGNGAFPTRPPATDKTGDVPMRGEKGENEAELSFFGSTAQQSGELHRQETMYGRRWLQETSRGGVEEEEGDGGGNWLRRDRLEALTSLLVPPHPSQWECNAAGQRGVDEDGTASYSYSDDGSDENSDSASDDAVQVREDDAGKAQHRSQQPAYEREGETEEEEMMVDGAALHRILSGVEHFKDDSDDEDYSRAYPTVPPSVAYPPRRDQNAPARPTRPFSPQAPSHAGRVFTGYPFMGSADYRQQRHHHQQHQQRYRHYSNAAQSPSMNGCASPHGADNGASAARVAMYAQALARDRESTASSPSGATASVAASSPTARGVPFRQTAAGPLKVHVLLGFDPELEIHRVRSPLWSRLPQE